jgi:hypothetical protein
MPVEASADKRASSCGQSALLISHSVSGIIPWPCGVPASLRPSDQPESRPSHVYLLSMRPDIAAPVYFHRDRGW